MFENETNRFPLSQTKKVKGTRRRAREKVLQVLIAHEVSGTEWRVIFKHAFYREFNFGDDEEVNKDPEKAGKLLTPMEVQELEADIPIEWEPDEIEFGQALVQYTLDNKQFTDGLIKEIAKNWELERIALIDRILMHIAVTELIKFPEIPPKVSINEAIDIAKKYSTDKSGTFINGVLDTILDRLRKEGKIKKSGRGLLEN